MTLPALVVALAACEPTPTTDSGTDAPAGMLREVAEGGKTDGAGTYILEIEVADGETAFQVTATTPGENLTGLQSVRNPDGKKVIDFDKLVGSPNNVTGSLIPQRSTTAFNWPIQESDGPLEPGTWELVWLVSSGSFFPQPRTNVDFVTAFKTDPDPTAAEVRVRILWARGADEQPKVVKAVEEAVEHWRGIWATENLTLVERFESTDLDPDLKFFRTGSADLEDASAGKEPGELQLVIGETIANDLYLYGVSAGIPGTVQISESTHVVMSWLTHTGRDGVFSNDEIKLMGETMAHELGHYSGLFHPVETGYYRWDSLRDTDECTDFRDCEAALGRNLMYPYSLCTPQECVNQTVITDDQSGVLHTFVGAL